ncbi:15816_t:CDS:2, partial [Funneliformis geosporum]
MPAKVIGITNYNAYYDSLVLCNLWLSKKRLSELFVTSLLQQVMEFNRTIIATLNVDNLISSEETKTQHEILTRELNSII